MRFLDDQNGMETLSRSLLGFEAERPDRDAGGTFPPRQFNPDLRVVASRTHDAADEVLNAGIVASAFRDEVMVHQSSPATQHATAAFADVQNLPGRIDQHCTDAEQFEPVRDPPCTRPRHNRLENTRDILGILQAEALQFGTLPGIWESRKRHGRGTRVLGNMSIL
jgi:hypothetical protein